MRKFKTFFLVLLFLGLISPKPSFSLDLYDDFSGTFIDKSKWKWGEWVREVDTGSGKLLLKHGSHNPDTASSFPYTTWNNLPFSDPNSDANSLNSIQADVTILQNQISGAGFTRARLEGRWFNDGTAGGGYAGDIYAEVGIRWTGTEFKGYWWVGRYPGASDTINPLGGGLFPATINIGVNYNLFIEYNSVANQFLFKIGSEEIPFGPAGLPAWAKNANNPWKSLTTRVQIDNQNSSGHIVATFDNVYKNGLLYDTFSSPTIDSAKWTDYEFVREIQGAKLRSKLRSSSTSNLRRMNSWLEFVHPSSINVIQAKVTPVKYQNFEQGITFARIGGHFYNDGTPGGGHLGLVTANVFIGGLNGETDPVAGWEVHTWADFEGNNPLHIQSGTFNKPILFNNTYTLFLGWDGSRLTFKIDDEEAHYDPTTSINPPNRLWKAIGTHIWDPAGQEATIEALFDDVIVNIDGNVFSDILTNYWAYDYIIAIYNDGITTGCAQDDPNTPENERRYCPEDNVTREQMAAFIVRAKEGEPAANYCDSGTPFPDVTSDMWSCRYIKRLKELGITTGYQDGIYGPYDYVPREQMAAFIVRAKEGEPAANYCDSGTPFPDVTSDMWSCRYIKRLKELGITTGYQDGTYGPYDIVTRAQMAAFLARAFLGME